MNEEDVPRSPALSALISRARQDGPSRARLDGVRARLESQLGPLGTSVDAAPPPPPRPDVSSSGSSPGTSGWILPTTIVIGVIALFAIGRSFLGTQPVQESTTQPRIGPTTTSESHETSSETEPPQDVVSPTELAGPASAEGPEVEPAADVEVHEASPSESTTRPSRVARDDPSAVEGAPPSDDPGSTLREEVLLMERAMRHRREGDLAAMRSVLAEHAARFPNGHLAPERTRLLGELAAEPAEGATP